MSRLILMKDADTILLYQNECIFQFCPINYDAKPLANASFALDQSRVLRNFLTINLHEYKNRALRNTCLALFSFTWRIPKVFKLAIPRSFQDT